MVLTSDVVHVGYKLSRGICCNNDANQKCITVSRAENVIVFSMLVKMLVVGWYNCGDVEK